MESATLNGVLDVILRSAWVKKAARSFQMVSFNGQVHNSETAGRIWNKTIIEHSQETIIIIRQLSCILQCAMGGASFDEIQQWDSAILPKKWSLFWWLLFASFGILFLPCTQKSAPKVTIEVIYDHGTEELIFICKMDGPMEKYFFRQGSSLPTCFLTWDWMVFNYIYRAALLGKTFTLC